MVIESVPPNVTPRMVPSAAAGDPGAAATATETRPRTAGWVPNRFDSRTRTAEPPTLVWTTLRIE
jgi:hypothetical protein